MRIDYGKVMPQARDAMMGLQRAADTAALEPRLVELVKIRASQLNGCASCLDMHTKDARAIGEGEQRLHLLAAWREAPSFSERERAALAWTESVTLLPQTGTPEGRTGCERSRQEKPWDIGIASRVRVGNRWRDPAMQQTAS